MSTARTPAEILRATEAMAEARSLVVHSLAGSTDDDRLGRLLRAIDLGRVDPLAVAIAAAHVAADYARDAHGGDTTAALACARGALADAEADALSARFDLREEPS